MNQNKLIIKLKNIEHHSEKIANKARLKVDLEKPKEIIEAVQNLVDKLEEEFYR